MRISCAGRTRTIDLDHSARPLASFSGPESARCNPDHVDPRTNLSTDVVKEVNKHFPNQVFKSVVPRSIRLAEAPSYGLPISVYAPASVGSQAMKQW